MLVPACALGITLSRRLLTSEAVADSAGPSLGITVKNAIVPALSIVTGVTATTPEVFWVSCCSFTNRGSVARGSDCEDEDDDEDEDEDEADELPPELDEDEPPPELEEDDLPPELEEDDLPPELDE